MTRFITLASLAVVVAFGSAAWSAVVLYDDFETYADTAEMNAVWNEGDIGAGTLDTGVGNPSKSLAHPAGMTNKRLFADTMPEDSNPIVWEFDLFDDGLDLPFPNKRLTGGLRTNGDGAPLESILEMGRYNNVAVPEGGPNVSGYGVRTVFVGGDPGDWIAFENAPPAEQGWHHFRATIGETSILFELDLQSDGTVDATRTIATDDGFQAYNVIRLGGPSDLSSLGGGGNFDNVLIRTGFVNPLTPGDMDCDGDVDFDDIDDFVLGLTDPGTYESTFGLPPRAKGDIDKDGDQDFDDIPGFVNILIAPDSQSIPEPSSVLLIALAALAMASLRVRLG